MTQAFVRQYAFYYDSGVCSGCKACQGAWWTPDKNGVDRRGSVNVLSSERWTPLAFGNAQHTIMVQAAKAGRR